jgi:hypothetical protein
MDNDNQPVICCDGQLRDLAAIERAFAELGRDIECAPEMRIERKFSESVQTLDVIALYLVGKSDETAPDGLDEIVPDGFLIFMPEGKELFYFCDNGRRTTEYLEMIECGCPQMIRTSCIIADSLAIEVIRHFCIHGTRLPGYSWLPSEEAMHFA